MNFPEGFLWGTATAAYQIEGAAAEDGRGPSIWDTFSHTPGKVYRGDTGDIACDHYHRLEEDLDLMAALGLKAYRFSVAWPRIQPEGSGEVNRKGLDFYRRLVDGLRERDIEPMLTLYHWDLPQALEDRGGWTSRQTSERFAEYAGIVYEALSGSVRYWITLNEPWVSAWMGYGMGMHAPGRRGTGEALAATHHLLLGHGLALEAMRAQGGNDRFGITLNLAPVRAASDEPADTEAARRVDGNANRLYLDPLFRGSYPEDMVEYYRDASDYAFVREGDLERISAPVDFLGVNYYMRHTVMDARRDSPDLATGIRFHGLGAATVLPPGVETTAMGWPVEPDGLTELLVRLKDEYTEDLPVYVTENGCAVYDYVDPEGGVDDVERISFLDAHFRAAHEAIERGVNLRGYMVWSLLDNFEWAEGYSKRFGIVFVDYGTQRRIPKASARWYREVIRKNGLPDAGR
ncbi:beta-glucosidase [Rubrobacter taiwanensis]|jgi:beta-glucosidase|uniref:Beta-glucosidase n=1 Tax=Rubrobacter taiwanensis TaxID=185139 RepID=A0A4R1BEP1_9ACTN|nr:GH1 family beta-glucosidase [Rubrobacter taiwanensis]TCJ15599.1 beta-glucosidase [Rubrobacter taiwanensis]